MPSLNLAAGSCCLRPPATGQHMISKVITRVLLSGCGALALAAAINPLLGSPPPPPSTTVSAVSVPTTSVYGMMTAVRDQQVATEQHEAVLAQQATAAADAKSAQAAVQPPPAPAPPVQQAQSYPAEAGALSASQIEALWTGAGGSAATEGVALCIAEHESGGRPGAISPTDDYGIWQIHDDSAALNPQVSAAVAVQMSSDGTNWGAWTTHVDCGV